MKVIGTAGHIDHGKSALVQVLTGMDPDRLDEEKRRGMTIDLGFAWLTLPSGEQASIVDVPGHERFVKNMLAGVGGIDLALLVVAADESVMPQTREHLDILDLLDVSQGVVVLTKCDLVERDFLQLVRADVTDFLAGTALEGSPIIAVSSVSGEGIPELLGALDHGLNATPPRSDIGLPLLPVDRVFTIAGFGTVVTGTLQDGTLRPGMELELVPGRRRVRVRTLETHRKRVEESGPGDRVAVNLAGVTKEVLRRGDVLAAPGTVDGIRRFFARIRVVRHAPFPLETGTEVMLYVGSAERQAVLSLVGSDRLLPGETGWASLRVSDPVPVVWGQRFIVRLPSPARTIAGGSIVHISPGVRSRRHLISSLSQLASENVQRRVVAALRLTQFATPHALSIRLRVDRKQVEDALERARDAGDAFQLGETYLLRQDWDALRALAQESVARFHEANPLKRGMPKEELRTRVHCSPERWPAVLGGLTQDGVLVDAGPLVSGPDETVGLDERRDEIERVLALLRTRPLNPPHGRELFEAADTDETLLVALADAEEVVYVGSGIYFAKDALDGFCVRLLRLIDEEGSVSVAQVRDRFGTSRKYALALLEHLDDRRITRRIGDARVRGTRAATCA